MSACCAFKDEKGFKIVINNKSFSAAEDNELVLDVGTVVDYSLVVILDGDVEKSIDKTGLTIVDEDNIIGTAPSAGTYEISIKYADFPAVVVKIIIQKINIAIPTVTTASFIYNNEAQTLELAGFDSSKMNITKNSATKVGSYTAVISLKDKDNYCWTDGTTEDIEIEWSILKAQAVAPTHEVLYGTYDPAKTLADYTLASGFKWLDETIVPTVAVNKYKAVYNPDLTNYTDSSEVEITLNIAKAQAVAPAHNNLSGIYDPTKTLANYSLEEDFTWVNPEVVPTVAVSTYEAKYNPDPANYVDALVNITLNVARAELVIPSADQVRYEYNGTEQTLDITNFNSSVMNISGNEATEVGSYTAVISLKDKDNYCWSDGTIEDIEIEWSIEEFELAITLTRPLEKEYDGLAINNPRYSVNAEVPVSHAFYTYVEDEWQEIERADIIEAGKYKIVIVTEGNDNYESITKVEEFFIYFNLANILDFEIGIVGYDSDDYVYLDYTGSAIEPPVYVKHKGEEIDQSLYTVTYENNVNFYEDACYIVAGTNELYRGFYKGRFYIEPRKMFSQVKVNGVNYICTDSSPYIYLSKGAIDDIEIELTLDTLYSELKGEFAYEVKDSEYKTIVARTYMSEDLKVTMPKDSYYIAIYYCCKDTSWDYCFGIHIFYVELLNWINGIYHINNDNMTMLPYLNLEGDLLKTIQTAIESKLYSIGYYYNCKISAVSLVEDKITFTLTADNVVALDITYTILDRPDYNEGYILSIDNPDFIVIDGYKNTITLQPGFEGDLEAVMSNYMLDAPDYVIREDYASSYIYDSLKVDGNVLTITLTKESCEDIVLNYEIIDERALAKKYINNIENGNSLFACLKSVDIDLEKQIIIVPNEFIDDLITDLKESLNDNNIIIMNSYSSIKDIYAIDDCIRFEIEYTYNSNTCIYNVDFIVVDFNSLITYFEIYDSLNYDEKNLQFNEANYIKITEEVNYAYYFNIWFDGTVTNWEVLKDGKVIAEDDDQYVNFGNLTSAGTYIIKVYCKEIFDIFTIEIENYMDECPAFSVFTYKDKSYRFGLDSFSDISIVMDMELDFPQYFYCYVGELEKGVDKFIISLKTLLPIVYDQDMNQITDFNNIELKILTDLDGNKYSVVYILVHGQIVPSYFYHYDNGFEENEDIRIKFANKTLVYSKTPIVDGDVTYYGDFVVVQDSIYSQLGILELKATITKSELDYIEGDTTIPFEVQFKNMLDVIIFNNSHKEISFAYGALENANEYYTIFEYDDDKTCINFGLGDILSENYTTFIRIEVIDDSLIME